MNIQTLDQLWLKVQSLEQQIVPMKEWRGGGAVKTVSVDSLGDVEEDLLFVQNQIKILSQKTFGLNEKKFIEAARKFSDVVGCLLVLRRECKIIDYKNLSTSKRVKKFFLEILGEYTYILTKSDPIDVFKVQHDITLSMRDMFLHQAPFYPMPTKKTEENVWGVEKNGDQPSYAVKIWIGQKDKQQRSVFDAIVTEQGIIVHNIPGIHESWEDASRKIREVVSIPGTFKNAVLLKQDAEKKMIPFIVNKEPSLGMFQGAWYIKREGDSYFFVKGIDKCLISITVEGCFFISGKNPKENIEDVFGETKETCLAQIYKEERERTLKKLRSKGVRGVYRDKKIYFSGGEKEVDLSRENNFGSVIVYDMDRPDTCTLVCVRPGPSVSNKLFEIQEDGQIAPELDIDAISFGCLKRVFFEREKKVFERMVKKDLEQPVDVDGLRHCCMANWCEPSRIGYRFVYKQPKIEIIAVIKNVVNKFFGSLNTDQPDGYAVEVFSPYKKLYYPISFQDNSFFVDGFDRLLSDISVQGISQKIEEVWKDVSLASIYKEISENKKKVSDAIQVIESMKIESGENLSLEAIETRLSIPSELYVLGDHDVWNNFDYIGCTWVFENEYVFSVRQKGKTECSHFFLDIRSNPGQISMQYQDKVIEAPLEEFKTLLAKTFSKIAFSEIWDKKYVEIRPFIDAFRSVATMKMKKEDFFKNVRFLGENAEGALYVEVSDRGKVVVYDVSGKSPKTINLLSAVQGKMLVVDGTAYDTAETFLFSFSNKKWKKLNEIDQLVVEKKIVVSTYVSKKVVTTRQWASCERGGKRPWEICFAQNFLGYLRSFFVRTYTDDMMNEVVLRLSADGKKKIVLDFVLKEGSWWIRADHRDFFSLSELLKAYNLKAEDSYEILP